MKINIDEFRDEQASFKYPHIKIYNPNKSIVLANDLLVEGEGLNLYLVVEGYVKEFRSVSDHPINAKILLDTQIGSELIYMSKNLEDTKIRDIEDYMSAYLKED